MARSDDPINLIGFIGHADADILPFFLDHYHRLGIGGFVLALHGDWDEAVLDRLDREPDVHIWKLLRGEYSEVLRLSVLNSIAESFRDQWILLADADEFLELPCATLRRTIATLEVLGLDCLPALLVQRQTADGSLPAADPDLDLQQQFPCYSLHLCEDMGLEWPVWKTEFPLARVTDDFLIQRGNHLPPNGRLVEQAPLRGVVHHFKWRDALRTALLLPRGEGANDHEMRIYEAWLADHDHRLPTTGARQYCREDLIERGFLVAPNRARLRIGALQRKAKEAVNGNESKKNRLARQLRRFGRAYGGHPSSERERDLIDPANLLLQPGRICLLTFELAPPASGGIGTAMTVLAERLSAAGHEVDVLFCPFAGSEVLWEGWYEYWAARGVRLHYLPRKVGPDDIYQEQPAFCLSIADAVGRLKPDLVHCTDAGGYGAFIALLKAAGLDFGSTRLMVTAHGSTAWHNRGNQRRWSPDEAAHSFCHDITMSLADVVCFPSQYMRDILAAADLGIRTAITVPNGLAGATRSFADDDREGPLIRPVNELVLFGRIEPRKGYDRFEAAIKALLDRGHRDFKVTLLGRFGDAYDAQAIRNLVDDDRITTRHIANFNHVDAVNYLKSRDCLAVIASLCDNLPYTVYECLENSVPLVTSAVGGIPELVHPDDRSRTLIADDPDALVAALANALDGGARPARLAFDPGLAEIELLAIHARLVDEARRGLDHNQSPISDKSDRRRPADVAALVYGDQLLPTTPRLIAGLLDAVADGPIKSLHLCSRLAAVIGERRLTDKVALIEPMPGESPATAVNRAVDGIDGEFLLFCHADVMPDLPAIGAMRRLIDAAAFDAVVSGYRAGLVDHDDALTEPMLAPGGPAALAPCHNLFGAGFFLIKRSAFQRIGGFCPDDLLHELAHWLLLNRLVASGGRVVGIPRSLATIRLDHPSSLADLMDNRLAEALARPWTDAVPSHVEGLIRNAMVADVGGGPTMRAIREELSRHQGGEVRRAGFA